MASTGSLFSQTLQDVTNTKLVEIAKKRKSFENKKVAVVRAAQDNEDIVKGLEVLANGVKSCFSVLVDANGQVVRGSTNNPRLEIDLKNLDRFLSQARYDHSMSSKLLNQWHESLLRHLNIQSLKYSMASLYGQLTTEWLQSKQAAVATNESGDTDMEDFEHVSAGKKLESRRKWENSVFEAASVDPVAIESWLEQTFGTKTGEPKNLSKALRNVHGMVRAFEQKLASPGNFTQSTLDWVINGLLASDLLTEEKRAVLKDFSNNPVVLNEIADVLNMRMSAFESWSWGNEVLLEERRQLNGSFNIYMHEDLLQAMFLQYLGVKWSVFWKQAFSQHYMSRGIWKSPMDSVPTIDKSRREYFLGPKAAGASVQHKRQRIYRKTYFLSQLLNSEVQDISTEQGEEEANFQNLVQPQQPPMYQQAPSNQLAKMQQLVQMQQQAPALKKKRFKSAPRKRPARLSWACQLAGSDEDESESEFDPHDDAPKNPMNAKQELLHLLSTDILIKTQLYGETTCFRSQLENLYPSLPHSTILTLLHFFGVSKKWLCFFERFLQVPLRFMDDDVSEPRLRKRGTPGSHVLSEVFGEIVLFSLDFKINQNTDGELLWRLHDDLWFWSSEKTKCVEAWTIVTSFAKTMGLAINESRSGSATLPQDDGTRKLTRNSVIQEEKLPQGQIRWGMLYLNATSGRFEIDQDMVDEHIEELNRQLEEKSKSVFAWIQAWNSYATTFFTSNFGKPANCFGRQHVDNMLATHERIQRTIFSSTAESDRIQGSRDSGSVVGYLKQSIEKRFDVKDIPDGYFFFPVEMGGLEVQSSFIGLLQIRDAVLDRPKIQLDGFMEAEKGAYDAAKKRFDRGGVRHEISAHPKFKPKDPHTFMSFEEYIRHRELVSYDFENDLAHIFHKLLQRPSEESVDCDTNGQISLALNALHSQQYNQNMRGILPNFASMEPYWKWVTQLYGPEIVERFGGFNIVDPGLLPIGMVSLFRSGRVTWQE